MCGRSFTYVPYALCLISYICVLILLYMCPHSALPRGAGADWDADSALDDARHVARARGTRFTCFTQFTVLDSALNDARHVARARGSQFTCFASTKK